MSYRDMRDAVKDSPPAQISEYDNPNLAGLLDYNNFVDL